SSTSYAWTRTRRSPTQISKGCPFRRRSGPSRDEGVGFADDLLDRLPARPAVEPHPHPAALAHVRRDEVPLRVGVDQRFLRAQRHREPDAHVRGAVVVVVELAEHLAADPEGRLAVGHLLRRAVQGAADPPQPFERARGYRVTCRMNRSGGSSPHWLTS